MHEVEHVLSGRGDCVAHGRRVHARVFNRRRVTKFVGRVGGVRVAECIPPRRTAGSKIVMSYCMASMECARNERSGLREASSKTKRALRAQSLELETGIGDLVLALLESEASFSGEIL